MLSKNSPIENEYLAVDQEGDLILASDLQPNYDLKIFGLRGECSVQNSLKEEIYFRVLRKNIEE